MKCRALWLVVPLALAGCASDWPLRLPAERVVVTREDSELPSGCRPRQVAERISAFLAAINAGDGSAARYAAPELGPHGGWYSVTEGNPRRGGRHSVASNRSSLASYFRRRHAHGERLRLLEVDVSYAYGLGHIAFRVDRRADDLRRLGIRTTVAHGKGALRCEDGKIVVWSMGMEAGPEERHLEFTICPSPSVPVRAIVACARR
jgi:hypothetical protein